MKIMFTTFPGLGHLFPIVPLAWAARTAGHQILVLTSGPAAEACGQAGLPAVDASPGINILEPLQSDLREKIKRARREMGMATSDHFKDPEMLRIWSQAMASICDKMSDRIVHMARLWKPDMIIHTPMEVAGPLAASLLSIPTVLHGIGPTGLSPRYSKQHMLNSLYQATRPIFGRHGLAGELAPPKAALDICPPSMQQSTQSNQQTVWPMSYVPYNGGGLLPDWLTEPVSGQRICVTLGTVVPGAQGVNALSRIIEALSDLDIEVILTLSEADLPALGHLPANVRVTGWVPLSELVPKCTLIIHHGGSGTTMNALAAGVPQLVIPHMADQYMNAASVQLRGVALTHLPQEANTKTVRQSVKQLLEDPSFSKAAKEVQQENATMPTPPEILKRILELEQQVK